ncbi:unnamed protein product [Phytophthora fragariaefolia]|uniref:Unnamed protein product n=1 Tax=Phytophthora fragariaefolia TaxID=1490495 RepID=A0A9W6Y5G5_9STRA|nr:unnamed protein product [Phytophthora fragariaefolia]
MRLGPRFELHEPADLYIISDSSTAIGDIVGHCMAHARIPPTATVRMSLKAVAAIARASVLKGALSRRDDPPPATPEPQVITNAGVDERVPPELLWPENWQHWSDRSRQAASQTMGAKRERETPAPTRANNDSRCDIGLGKSTARIFARVGCLFEGWLHHLGNPEFSNPPFRIDWLAQCRLRFRMAKMIADDTWAGRFLERHKRMPGVILEEVFEKIQKSWQSQPTEPRRVLGSVSADQVRGRSQKRPRCRRRPRRGEPQAPTSFDYSGSHATSPGTGNERYARGALIASRHGNRGRPRYQSGAAEPASGVVSDQDAQRRPTGSRPDLESLLAGLESCQRQLDGQRTKMVALRARV